MSSFLKRLLIIETWVAGVFFALAASILFFDVVARELFQTPIWGGQRMAVLLANAAALMGLAIAAHLNRHLRPAVLDRILPYRFDGFIKRTGHLVSASVLFAGAYFAVKLVLENKAMGFTSQPLDVPVWLPQLALPYGLASAGLRYLFFTVQPRLQVQNIEGA